MNQNELLQLSTETGTRGPSGADAASVADSEEFKQEGETAPTLSMILEVVLVMGLPLRPEDAAKDHAVSCIRVDLNFSKINY